MAAAEAQLSIQKVGDLELAYRAQGEGSKHLVLIHGLAQDHRMWAEAQDELSDFKTFAIDFRGHGATPLGAADGTLAQLGSDLIGFLEATGPAVCVGFSLGGTIACWTAAERPDLVQGVVAMATSSVVGSKAADGMRERIEIANSQDQAAFRELLLADTRIQLAGGTADAAAIADERLKIVGDRSGYVNGLQAMLGMSEQPLNDRLARISPPVMVVSGGRDAVCPPRAAEIMREHLPKSAEFVELAGAGHLMTDEAPEDVSAVLRKWLARQDPRG